MYKIIFLSYISESFFSKEGPIWVFGLGLTGDKEVQLDNRSMLDFGIYGFSLLPSPNTAQAVRIF